MSNVLQRILVGVIGIPVFIAMVLGGAYYFFALLLLLSNLCLWEFFNITKAKQAFPIKSISYLMNNLFLTSIFISLIPSNSLYFVPVFFIGIILNSILHIGMNLWNTKPNNILNISTGHFSFNYITLFFASLLMIANFNSFSASAIKLNIAEFSSMQTSDWQFIVLAFFIAIWSSDTFAYFIGSAIGRHRLFQRISPKKSWEGAIAGFFGSTIAFFLIAKYFIPAFPVILSLVIGAFIGIIATVGDLAESQLKRDANIKDSSNIIPGHGGVLDRFDSILFTSPALLLILIIYSIF